MSPLLSGKPLPLYLWHASAAEYQSAELIDHSILLPKVIIGKILLQSLEEFSLSTLLALKAEAYQRGDRFTHTGIDGLSVVFYLMGETRG